MPSTQRRAKQPVGRGGGARRRVIKEEWGIASSSSSSTRRRHGRAPSGRGSWQLPRSWPWLASLPVDEVVSVSDGCGWGCGCECGCGCRCECECGSNYGQWRQSICHKRRQKPTKTVQKKNKNTISTRTLPSLSPPLSIFCLYLSLSPFFSRLPTHLWTPQREQVVCVNSQNNNKTATETAPTKEQQQVEPHWRYPAKNAWRTYVDCTTNCRSI